MSSFAFGVLTPEGCVSPEVKVSFKKQSIKLSYTKIPIKVAIKKVATKIKVEY